MVSAKAVVGLRVEEPLAMLLVELHKAQLLFQHSQKKSMEEVVSEVEELVSPSKLVLEY